MDEQKGGYSDDRSRVTRVSEAEDDEREIQCGAE